MSFYDSTLDHPDNFLVADHFSSPPAKLSTFSESLPNPLIKANSTYISLDEDVDPDTNLLAPLSRILSNYYLEDQFNDFINQHNLQYNLKIIHLNIHSYNKNNSDFLTFINNLEAHFDIIALTETWTSPITQDGLKYPGYDTFAKSRTVGNGGGLALFTDHEFSSQVLDLKFCPTSPVEVLFVNISLPTHNDITIGSAFF